MDAAALVDPFLVLLLLTFGVLLAALGVFLLIWSGGRPRAYGAGFLVAGVVAAACTLEAVWSGVLLRGASVLMDVIVPGVVYFIAIAVGAALAAALFLLAVVRS
ncbi:MAG: hypothetical protein ACUVV6_04735 [Thermoplasmatota archaeon]